MLQLTDWSTVADLINMSQIAKRAGVSRQAVKQWFDAGGSFPAPVRTDKRQTLFDRDAVDAWLREVKEIDPVEPAADASGIDDIESKLWAMADKLRGHMDAAEYKHVVLGLIFLKYISDRFEERHAYLAEHKPKFVDDRSFYDAEHVFYVPDGARWEQLQASAKQPGIGKRIDDAMIAIERENESLRGVLPKEYARPALDASRLGGVIDLISSIGLGSEADRSKDVLGRVYEYFLSRFASAEGKLGGEFYTPQPVVRLLVEMLEPYKGRVYDPCCGAGGMFVQSEKFALAHQGRINDLSIFGQESNHTTWKLAKMNLAIRGFDGDLGPHNDDTFRNDLHKQLKAEYIIANPPFNISDWGGDLVQDDVRWKFGAPRANNANYAWIQHFIHHLHPSRGTAGFVLANGAMSSTTGSDGDIRRKIVEADLVDCMIALPGQLFYTTQIPVCLWFLTTSKRQKQHRDRRAETLFIDARGMGEMQTRTLRVLTDEEITRIAGTYHAWRGSSDDAYEDVPGFCRSADIDEIAKHDFVLTPGRYVGSEAVKEDSEPFEEKLARLEAELVEQFDRSRALEDQIRANFRRIERA